MADVQGTAGNDILVGTTGDDEFHGNGGDDSMSGLAGNDVYYVEDSGDDVFELDGEGVDTVFALATYILNQTSFVEFVTADPAAGNAAMDLTGNHQDQTITGNDGANGLHGGGGADVLVGLGGDDIYYTDFATAQVVEVVGAGADALYTSVSYVLAGDASIELLSANSHVATSAIDLTGNNLDQTIVGNDGANILNGGGGTDMLVGRGGDDTYYVDVTATQVVEEAGEGTDALFTSVSYVLGRNSSIELLSVNSHAATTPINLTGSRLNQTVMGNDGANALHGGGGTDVLIGRGGDDNYYTDVAATQVIEEVGEGTDALYTSVSYVLGGNSSIELLSVNSHAATTAIDLTGNYLDQSIYGNNGANLLNGGGGTDILYGMGGDDIFYIDVATTQVVESDEYFGTDTVYTSVSYVLAFGQSVEILSVNDDASTAAINLTGNNGNNRIVGNAGANILDGDASQDVLFGYGGNDTLIGGLGNDQLHGGDGEDSLRGGDGNDRLFGGLGDDIYHIEDASDDTIFELVGEGSDIVYTEVSYILQAEREVEIVAFANPASTAAQYLWGNEFGNELRGSEGDNILLGHDGNDILYGYGGNDLLSGDEGLDTLNGGAGADSFRFNSAPGAGNIDTIADFEVGIDKIGLTGGIFGVTEAQLAAGAFRTGTAAADADDRIIYDNATGALYFDSDGVGGAAQIQFAFLTGAPPITAADFIN